MVDKTEVLHLKFPFGHSVLRTSIQQPYHFEVRSQSLIDSASFSHTEISFDSSPKRMLKSNMCILYTDPWKHTVLWRRLVDSPTGVEGNVFISGVETGFMGPLLAPWKREPPPSFSMQEEKVNAIFLLRLWIITFMLRDQFASLKWKTISCLDETFPWMLSINWALKLLTRNSGLSCLKTQSGSWKHCRFFDLQKLASSMRLLTALFVCYSERAIQNNPCLSILVSLSIFVLTSFSDSITHLSVSVSLSFVSLLFISFSLPLSLPTLSLTCSCTVLFLLIFYHMLKAQVT